MSNDKSSFTCPLCANNNENVVYSSTSNLNRHLKSKHGVEKSTVAHHFDVFNHKCLDCKLSFKFIAQLRDHLEIEHDILQAREELMFSTEEELRSWITSLVDEESCQYRLTRGAKKRKEEGSEVEITYYNCHRSVQTGGNRSELTTRKRALKKQGSCKLDYSCTSQIKVEKISKRGPYKVTFFKTHYKHELDVQHLPIPQNTRASVAEKYASGVPFDSILDDCRALATEKLRRSALITRKDIFNITKYSRRNPIYLNISVEEGSHFPEDDSPQDIEISQFSEPSESVPTCGSTNTEHQYADPGSNSYVINGRLVGTTDKPTPKSNPRGPRVQDDVPIDWPDIARDGLSEKEKSALVARYPIPENCGCCVPPILNDKLRQSLTEDQVATDEKIAAKQGKLGACLAASANMLSSLVSIPEPSNDEESLIAILRDQSRLLLDLFHEESDQRRSLIQAAVCPDVKEPLPSTSINYKRFSSKLEETTKSDKTPLVARILRKTSTPSKLPKNSKNSNTPAA